MQRYWLLGGFPFVRFVVVFCYLLLLPSYPPSRTLCSNVCTYIYIICIIHPSNATSSSYVQRITAEQAAIQEQLVEVHGMEVINTGLKNTRITGDDDSESMIGIDDVEMKPEPAHPMKNAIDAKKRAIARFVSFFCSSLSILYLALPRIKYFNWDHWLIVYLLCRAPQLDRHI